MAAAQRPRSLSLAVCSSSLRAVADCSRAQVPDPVTSPPVVGILMDATGRFGFVELRTEELSAEAMKLDRVNVQGREINVGRPKGYIEPPPGSRRDPNEVRGVG